MKYAYGPWERRFDDPVGYCEGGEGGEGLDEEGGE